ncbi:MAG: hypothetical protein ACREQE_09315, partial [Candidatus Binataceae bacterium]
AAEARAALETPVSVPDAPVVDIAQIVAVETSPPSEARMASPAFKDRSLRKNEVAIAASANRAKGHGLRKAHG